MVWAKAWQDTRWRFAIFIAVLIALTCFHVFEWPRVQSLLATVDPSVAGGNATVRNAVAEAIAAEQTFRGYVWYQWFDQNFATCIVLFAALLGSGSALSTSGRGLLFSLALPVARGRWLETRAAIGIAQVLALALVPSLLIPLLAPAVGESYSVTDALVHGALIFVLGACFSRSRCSRRRSSTTSAARSCITAVAASVVGLPSLRCRVTTAYFTRSRAGRISAPARCRGSSSSSASRSPAR